MFQNGEPVHVACGPEARMANCKMNLKDVNTSDIRVPLSTIFSGIIRILDTIPAYPVWALHRTLYVSKDDKTIIVQFLQQLGIHLIT